MTANERTPTTLDGAPEAARPLSSRSRGPATIAGEGRTFLLALALALVAACQPPCHTGAGWTLAGAPVPSSYAAEVDAAVSVLQRTEGLCGGGTVDVHPAPFACYESPTGWCAGLDDGVRHVEVAYDEALGLGPALGSTALEHELCHASGIDDEAGANACAAANLPAIKAALAP